MKLSRTLRCILAIFVVGVLISPLAYLYFKVPTDRIVESSYFRGQTPQYKFEIEENHYLHHFQYQVHLHPLKDLKAGCTSCEITAFYTSPTWQRPATFDIPPTLDMLMLCADDPEHRNGCNSIDWQHDDRGWEKKTWTPCDSDKDRVKEFSEDKVYETEKTLETVFPSMIQPQFLAEHYAYDKNHVVIDHTTRS